MSAMKITGALQTAHLSGAAGAIVRRAAWLGTKPGEPPVASFTSLFLAFLTGDDEFSRWARETAEALGPDTSKVVERWKSIGGPADFTNQRLVAARALPLSELPVGSDSTPSAREVQYTAQALADAAGSRATEARHLFAAGILLTAEEHTADLAAWGLNQERWAALVLDYVTRTVPSEANAWREALKRFERAPSVGIKEATRWATALARRRGEAAIALVDLLQGVYLDGLRYKSADVSYTSSWLAKTVGERVAEPMSESPDVGSEALPLSADVQGMIGWAGFVATASRDREIHVRHLLAAIFTRRGLPATRILGRPAAQLLGEMTSWGRGKNWDEPTAWDEVVDVATRLRFAAQERTSKIDNDDADGEDRLGVSADVSALASVLASRQLEPPLSVGLFGDWGSGKSFYMRKMRDRIGLLARQSRAALAENRPTSYCSEIVQIDFNAWQYMDANLWASIVTRVFDRLNEELEPPRNEALATAGYIAELASIKERQGELQRESEALAASTKTLDEEIAKLRKEREDRRPSFQEVLKALLKQKDEDPEVKRHLEAAAQQLGLDRVWSSLQAAQKERNQLEHLMGRLIAWWRAIRKSPWKLAFVVALLALPVGAECLRRVFANNLPTVGFWLGGAFLSLLGVIQWARAVVDPAVKAIDSALGKADAVEAEARGRISDEERARTREFEELTSTLARVQADRATLAQRRSAIEGELASLKNAKNYKRFVTERASKEDYRRQLGIITSIHEDFSGLSKLLATPEEPHVDRIILYIDDLDRCPPDRVVEVLQALHLILSLKLFVVVVAVDSRWLIQSLEAYYRKNFGDDNGPNPGAEGLSRWASGPQNYLEKIFQIPVAVPPMNPDGFADLVGGLLGEQVVKKATQPKASDNATVDEVQAPPAVVDRGVAASAEPADVGPARSGFTAEPNIALDLTPRALEIEEAELAHLKTLGVLVGSPRSAKRLVNLYRIVRATLDDEALGQFLAGEYRLVQICLAAVVGRPACAASLFDSIFDGRVCDPAGLDRFIKERSNGDPEWCDLAALLSDVRAPAEWQALMDAARSASRFSFQTGRVLQRM
jgi:hypothetical protein